MTIEQIRGTWYATDTIGNMTYTAEGSTEEEAIECLKQEIKPQ